MEDKVKDLCLYRYRDALETLEAARLCYAHEHYKDAVNRSYYAAFYAVKAVLALEIVDFKRHKEAVAYFNHRYVASDIFPREVGRSLGRLKRKRETSDYDAFYIASREETREQIQAAEMIVESIGTYLGEKGIGGWQ